MFYRVVDFETSGDAPDGEVIEIGWCDIHQDGTIEDPISLFVHNTRPISIETKAVHHIQERDLIGAMPRTMAINHLLSMPLDAIDMFSCVDAAYVAHSSKFEAAWFPEAMLPWICTFKASIRVWPESPRHSNQVLRYFLGLDLPSRLAMPPHRAGADAYVTAHVFKRLLERASPEDMIRWTDEPALLPRVTFGEHRGKPWSEVDDGLLRWTLGKDFDEDVMHTVRTELGRREAACEASYRERSSVAA